MKTAMILIVHRTSVVIFIFLFLRNAGRFEWEDCFLVLMVKQERKKH